MIKGFSPILCENPKYLILGSAPSVISLKENEYYGNKKNSFWIILSNIFNESNLNSYPEKIEFIKKSNIILWDVVKTCSRKGSLDSEIKDVEVNDIKKIIEDNDSIIKVFFNGQTANKLYKRYINYYKEDVEYITLPSSSPAYTLKIQEKIKIWKSCFK